jgi:hypothetical protein
VISGGKNASIYILSSRFCSSAAFCGRTYTWLSPPVVLGIYAVLAYSVSQRKRELGIRMALSAERWQILRLVLKNGMGLTLIGVACGIAASLALTWLLAGLLFDIRATDPLAFSAAAFLLVITAFFGVLFAGAKSVSPGPDRGIAVRLGAGCYASTANRRATAEIERIPARASSFPMALGRV